MVRNRKKSVGVVLRMCGLLAIVAAMSGTPAFAAEGPANDNFSGAVDIRSSEASVSDHDADDSRPVNLWYTHFTSTVGAGTEAGEPTHAADPGSPSNSVWYRWTAPWDASVRARAVASGDFGGCFADTNLAVYTGAAVNALAGVNSSHSGPCEYATVTFEARAGTTYRVALDSPGEAFGWMYFEVRPYCSIRGTENNETLTGTARNEVMCGLGGNDRIVPGAGDDVVVGGDGVDAVDYSDSSAAVSVMLNSGSASGNGHDHVFLTENVIGSAHSDTINGDSGANTLNAGPGADRVYGLDRNDIIYGGDGPDTIGGSTGDDRIIGGAGNDTVDYNRAARVTIDLSKGTASGQGADSILTVENVIGSPGNDALTGNRSSNTLRGGGGSDSVAGLEGNDRLVGLAGNDFLNGGPGTDVCDGGTGTDSASTSCESRVDIP
jgi:Ca2+-binding RTX toxin-like protein